MKPAAAAAVLFLILTTMTVWAADANPPAAEGSPVLKFTIPEHDPDQEWMVVVDTVLPEMGRFADGYTSGDTYPLHDRSLVLLRLGSARRRVDDAPVSCSGRSSPPSRESRGSPRPS